MLKDDLACLNMETANNQNRIADKNPLAFRAVTETYIRITRLYQTNKIIIATLLGLLTVKTQNLTNPAVQQIW